MLVWLVSGVALADPLVAVVVVDQEAREVGYALELDALVIDDALPIDVAEGEHVTLVDPQGERHELDVSPGEAWEITGRKGEAWMSKIGEEVRTDVIEVRGSADAVAELADALGADVKAQGDRVWLVRDGILFDAPWVEAEERASVDEVRFVPVDPEPEVRTAPSPAVAPRPVVRALAPTRAGVSVALETALSAPAPAGAPAPASISDILAAVEAPAAPVVEAPTTPVELDPLAYVGLYLCGDGTMLLLSPTGSFSHSRAVGEWKVSAPGVVRLEVGGRLWGRAGIDVAERHCRAVG